MKNISSTPLVRFILAAFVATTTLANARDVRVFRIPNGTVNSCLNCHVTSNGGPRNPFGLAVEAKIGGTPADVAFWDASLAAADSDNDGFTNGQELGDPDGDFANIGSPSLVTNPGNPASKPAVNTAPSFTSSAITTAAIATAYSYTAAATDSEGHSITFSKASGPSWLSVAANGAVTGTPLESDTGDVTVTIRATDNGSPAATRDQTYTLTVRATFAGWQNIHFTLPAENAIAAAGADPDGDGFSNLIEYALRMNPRVPAPYDGETRSFDVSDRFVITWRVRDDAPGLSVTGEFSSLLPFTSFTSVTGLLTDPNTSDGFKTATLTDTVTRTSAGTRFVRFKVSTTE